MLRSDDDKKSQEPSASFKLRSVGELLSGLKILDGATLRLLRNHSSKRDASCVGRLTPKIHTPKTGKP